MWFVLIWAILFNNFLLTNETKSTEYFAVMATTGAIRRMCMGNFWGNKSLKDKRCLEQLRFIYKKILLKPPFFRHEEIPDCLRPVRCRSEFDRN